MILTILIQCFFVFLATIGFSILFNVDFKEIIYCGLTGLICFLIYKILFVYYNAEFLGAILGIFVAVLIARRFAFLRKTPAAIYIIPALIPLAPGGYIYLTVYGIINADYINILKYSFITMKIAGGIVIGMSLALSMPNKWFNYSISEKKR